MATLVTRFHGWDDMVTRGWGSMRRTGNRWLFIPQFDQATTVPLVVGKVHRRVAPLVVHLLDWLVDHRGRPLDKVGNWGGAVRPIRGREAAAYAGQVKAWSNHAGLIAVDIEAPRNGMGQTGRGDFPPGWLEECHRCGFVWGAGAPHGDYSGRPDRMHIEFVGTPEQADVHVARLRGATPVPTPAPAVPDPREDDPAMHIPIAVDAHGEFAEAVCLDAGNSRYVAHASLLCGSTWGSTSMRITALDHQAHVIDSWTKQLGNNQFDSVEIPPSTKILTIEGDVEVPVPAADGSGPRATRPAATVLLKAT